MIMREPLSYPAVRSFHQSDRLTTCLWSTFYGQQSSDDMFSQGHLIVLSNICVIQAKATLFSNETNFKKEPINFCKLYDKEETTQLPLPSHHFINPTVSHLTFSLNFITSILLMISFHKGKAVNVPWDTGKRQDTSFGMKKFSKKEPINFCKYYLVREPFSSTKCVVITLLR